MTNRYGMIKATTATLFGLLPSLAFAGSPTVTLGPFAGASVTPVPALSDGLLIALGVVLAVVALRTIRQKLVYQKVLSVVLLGCGLVIGGMGVERTVATTTTPILPESDLCSGATGDVNLNRGETNPTLIQNTCESQVLEVLSYSGMSCTPEQQITIDADVGDTLEPGQTVTLNYCPSLIE